AGPRVAGFADPLLASHRAAAVGGPGETKIAADLAAIVEGAIERFAHQRDRAGQTDPTQPDQVGDLGGVGVAPRRCDAGPLLGFELGDLRDRQPQALMPRRSSASKWGGNPRPSGVVAALNRRTKSGRP